jgi:hypothetical protein
MTYYYLAASLVPIEFGDVPELSFLDLVDQYEMNLTQHDLHQVNVVRLYFDLENIRQFYTFNAAPMHLDPRGNLSQQDLKESLEDHSVFPQYVYDFLHQHEAHKDALFHFPELISAYFAHEQAKTSNEFLKQYLEFERNWRLILTGFRAKRLKRNLRREFAFEDVKDPVVSLVLSQQESPYFESPSGYEELQEMLLASQGKPMYQYRHLAEFRFRKLREMVQGKPFSIGYLLSYLLRVAILEDLKSLDEVKGREVLNGILKDTA